jgi:calcium channel MID1
MHLSPLQSRLVASLVASCLLIALYWTLFTPHFAVALEVEEKTPILLDDVDFTANSGGPLDPSYEPEFSAFDRSIIGRAPEGVTALTNNEAMPMNVVAGTTQLFTFSVGSLPERGTAGGSLELRSEQTASEQQSSGTEANKKTKLAGRQESRTVFISANTCEQPRPIAPSRTGEAPPQLTLYISTSSANQSPGPLADTDSQVIVDFIEGAAMYNFTVSDDVYIGVHAPNTTSFTGAYNFRIAASTDAYFYTYNGENNAGLIFVDSDSQGALLITHNLTDSSDPAVEQKLMGSTPYVMFAHNKNDPSINGLRFSYCGLQNRAQIAATKDGQFANMVSTAMTKRGPGNLPKQQFFFSGLNASSNYSAILAKDGTASGNGLVGGGGLVFRATDFNTKSGKTIHRQW